MFSLFKSRPVSEIDKAAIRINEATLYQQHYAELMRLMVEWFKREYDYFKSVSAASTTPQYQDSLLFRLSVVSVDHLIFPEGRRTFQTILTSNPDISATGSRLHSFYAFLYTKYGKAFMDEMDQRFFDYIRYKAIPYHLASLGEPSELEQDGLLQDVKDFLGSYPHIVLVPIYQQLFSPSSLALETRY